MRAFCRSFAGAEEQERQMVVIALKPHHHHSLEQRHPWVFAGALLNPPAQISPGETVDLLSRDGVWCGRGSFSPHSQIAVRIWTFDRKQTIDSSFFANRLEAAISRRRQYLQGCSTTAYRLVNAESDGLPGLTIDRYGEYLVIQCTAAGAEFWKADIVQHLNRLIPNQGIFERSDGQSRRKEGLTPCNRSLSGAVPPDLLEIREEGARFLVNVIRGHKTGFYLDQRENRQEILPFVAGQKVLNCFCYSGGFTINALLGGAASVTNIDESRQALEILQQNLLLNHCDPSKVETIQGDAFTVLRQLVSAKHRFDLIILDPPKFADSQSNTQNAVKGYRDINRLAFLLLNPGGLLLTFSCSGLLDPVQFQKIVTESARNAGRQVQLLKRLGQAMDHPILLNFPEGHYLKGLVCRAD